MHLSPGLFKRKVRCMSGFSLQMELIIKTGIFKVWCNCEFVCLFKLCM